MYHDFPDLINEIKEVEKRADYGMLTRHEFNKEVAELLNISEDDIETKYWANSVRNEAAIDWIKSLKKGGYKTALLSNIGRGWLDQFITDSERRELFDVIVLSSEVFMTKPDPNIFDYTVDKLGFDNSECVMIDDQLVNTDAAAATGMQTILFGYFPQAIGDFERMVEGGNA